MPYSLLLILAVFWFDLQLVLAFPVSVHPDPHSKHSVCRSRQRASPFRPPLHNHPTFHAKSAPVETLSVVLKLASDTATFTEVVPLRTGFPNASVISSVVQSDLASATPALASTSLPSIESFAIETSAYSTLPAASEFTSSSATPHPSSRSLATGSLIVIAIAGSVAVNIIALILCLLFRRSYSKRVWDDKTGKEEREIGQQGDASKHNFEHHDILTPEVVSRVQLGAQNPPPRRLSTPGQRFPLPFPSFWSSASSWSLERARSQEPNLPRRLLTFGLGVPVGSRSNSTPAMPEKPSSSQDSSRGSLNQSEVEASPVIHQDNELAPSLRGSVDELSADPRSPRHLSIPLFVENYSSPNLVNHLPPESRSTIITESRRGPHSVRTSSLLHDVEYRAESEIEPQSRKVSTSLVSLPSVSSEVMTPRRHWTFVDVHGPATSPVTLYGLPNIVDRLSDSGSSPTISAMHDHSTGTDIFASAGSSRAPISELPSAHSFLHYENYQSTTSGFTQYRSANNNILQDVQYGGCNN